MREKSWSGYIWNCYTVEISNQVPCVMEYYYWCPLLVDYPACQSNWLYDGPVTSYYYCSPNVLSIWCLINVQVVGLLRVNFSSQKCKCWPEEFSSKDQPMGYNNILIIQYFMFSVTIKKKVERKTRFRVGKYNAPWLRVVLQSHVFYLIWHIVHFTCLNTVRCAFVLVF